MNLKFRTTDKGKKMKITNCKEPEIVSYIAPWFVPREKSIVEICTELKERLNEKPDETLCLIATEEQICQAVLVAYKENGYVWVWQARAKRGFPHSKVLFELLKKWAEMMGVTELRAKSSRRVAAFLKKKYKFTSSNGELRYEWPKVG